VCTCDYVVYEMVFSLLFMKHTLACLCRYVPQYHLKTVHGALSSAIDHIDGNVTEESGLALAYTSARAWQVE